MWQPFYILIIKTPKGVFSFIFHYTFFIINYAIAFSSFTSLNITCPNAIEITVGINHPNPISARGIKLKLIPGIADNTPKNSEVYTPSLTALMLVKNFDISVVKINVIETGYNIFNTGTDSTTILSTPKVARNKLIIDIIIAFNLKDNFPLVIFSKKDEPAVNKPIEVVKHARNMAIPIKAGPIEPKMFLDINNNNPVLPISEVVNSVV